MAELPERDTALLLDMLLAARDAQTFVEGLDEAAFLASRLLRGGTSRPCLDGASGPSRAVDCRRGGPRSRR